MRPSSISGKPRPAGPQSPEITPCTVASSLLGFSPSGLARIPSPRAIGRSEWITVAAGDFLLLLFLPVLSLSFPREEHDRGWWDGPTPAPLAHA